jgi:hypothetical protein
MLKKICIYLVSAIIIANILFMSNSTLESNAIGGIVFDIDTALQQGTNNVFRLVDNTRGVGSARRDDNWTFPILDKLLILTVIVSEGELFIVSVIVGNQYFICV